MNWFNTSVALIVFVAMSLVGRAQTTNFSDPSMSYMVFTEKPCFNDPFAACPRTMAYPTNTSRSCVEGLHYVYGREIAQYNFRLCIEDCTNGKPALGDSSCKVNPCAAQFLNKRGWQASRALDLPDQEALSNFYHKLIALVESAKRGDRSDYQKLGGDQERIRVKKEIVNIVLDKMIPYMACTTPAMDRKDFEYRPGENSDTSIGAETLAQVKAFGLGLIIYEGAFLEKDKTGHNFPPDPAPDTLAAVLIHEAIHFQQGRDLPTGNLLLPMLSLDELWAYDYCRTSTFYKMVLHEDERAALIDVGMKYQISRFYQSFAQLSLSERQELAKWAWQKEFMRRMMAEYPGENGGIWGKLCAQNKGPNVCGM